VQAGVALLVRGGAGLFAIVPGSVVVHKTAFLPVQPEFDCLIPGTVTGLEAVQVILDTGTGPDTGAVSASLGLGTFDATVSAAGVEASMTFYPEEDLPRGIALCGVSLATAGDLAVLGSSFAFGPAGSMAFSLPTGVAPLTPPATPLGPSPVLDEGEVAEVALGVGVGLALAGGIGLVLARRERLAGRRWHEHR